jgi:ABC-type molybdate transport system permease subunit
MNTLIVRTMIDLRSGRQSWRVFALVCLPSFAAGIVAGIVQLG